MSEVASKGDVEQPLPARCCNCFYVIEHLDHDGICPECGQSFNLSDPLSFTRKPPFIWWKFWMPAFITALGVGFGLYVVLIVTVGYTWASVVCVPVSIGVIMGYNARAANAGRMLLLALVIGGTALGLIRIGLAGMFCGLVLAAIAIVPSLIGLAFGMALGGILKGYLRKSGFSQRWHLLLPLGFPILVALLEGRHTHMSPVTLTTSLTIHTPIQQAWNSIQFYEQVKHRPPWLLMITPEFRPRYTTGNSEHVGDQKVCVYERGRLVKQITEVIPGKRLAFNVVEQTDIETRGVRLIDGSFDLVASDDGKATVVTLTTRYEPLLAPRFAFLPSEMLAVHTLHGHVLHGMQLDAEGRQ